MDFRIIFVSRDGATRTCHCDDYFDAIEIFDVLSRKHNHVALAQHTLTTVETGEKLYKTVKKYNNK
jgi:hypothetical protein